MWRPNGRLSPDSGSHKHKGQLLSAFPANCHPFGSLEPQTGTVVSRLGRLISVALWEVNGMEQIVIRKLDKVETTSDSGPNGN